MLGRLRRRCRPPLGRSRYYHPLDSGSENTATRNAACARCAAVRRWLARDELDGPAEPPPFDEPPPRRSDFDVGSEGRAQYHAARAEWYRNITRSARQPDGMALAGSLADQNDLFDRIARRYRQ